MISDCVLNEPRGWEKIMWFLVILVGLVGLLGLLGHFVGAAVYFCLRRRSRKAVGKL
jgi:hypothetical protein